MDKKKDAHTADAQKTKEHTKNHDTKMHDNKAKNARMDDDEQDAKSEANGSKTKSPR